MEFKTFIYLLLIISEASMLTSAVIWTFTTLDDHWIWFSRFIAGLLLLGLSQCIPFPKTK